MKLFFLLCLLGACGYVAYTKFGNEITTWLGPSAVPKSTKEEWNNKYPDRPYDQYFDAERAFAKDQLFAVMSKKVIGAEYYEDHFEKNAFGDPSTKSLPAVYIIRCLGRETRENYLFIVDRKMFDSARIHQKFSKEKMSNYEFFLSEERLEETVFHRRFRDKMLD